MPGSRQTGRSTSARPARQVLLYVALLLTLCVAAAGWYLARRGEVAERLSLTDDLASIAELKAEQLDVWLKERRGDAEVVRTSTRVAQMLATPERAEARRLLQRYFRDLRGAYDYTLVALYDAQGALVLADSADDRQPPGCSAARVQDALRTSEVAVADLHRAGPADPIHLSLLSPVLPSAGGAPIGVLLLVVDPGRFLYPFLARWPAATHTGEALLLRRDGDRVVYLNDTRVRPGTALDLRTPMTNSDDLVVRAVLGEQGLMAADDYRGTPVLALARRVHGMPWTLVVKADRAELEAPLRQATRLLGLALGLAVFAMFMGLGLLMRHWSLLSAQEEIQQRLVVEAELRNSEEKLRQLIAAAQDGIVMVDAEGRVSLWNDAATRILGYPRDEALGQELHHLLVPERFQEGIDLAVSVFRQTGRGRAIDQVNELVARRKDGTEFPVEISVAPLQLGQQWHAVGIIRDITARKQAEEDLRARNDELVRFTYTVSHDLKSPLVTIQTFLGFLEQDLEKSDNGRVQTDIGYIRRASAKMLTLLDELLELSRVGRKMNPPVDTPFEELVRAALDAVAGRVAERGVQVRVQPASLLLHGDRVRLTEVFQNLLDNAVKFMGDQPEPLVEVGVEQVGSEYVFSVRDNGLGIDPRHAHKLFGLFEKLHPELPGSGMGLALIKRIVEVHGGRIWCESAGPGQGSIFRFSVQGTRSA